MIELLRPGSSDTFTVMLYIFGALVLIITIICAYLFDKYLKDIVAKSSKEI